MMKVQYSNDNSVKFRGNQSTKNAVMEAMKKSLKSRIEEDSQNKSLITKWKTTGQVDNSNNLAE